MVFYAIIVGFKSEDFRLYMFRNVNVRFDGFSKIALICLILGHLMSELKIILMKFVTDNQY